MISYEVSIGIIILTVVISSGELNLTGIVMGQQEI
jgi:NADH:ubiquinone oxidoreductase subunit H